MAAFFGFNKFSKKRYYKVWARAIGTNSVVQPMLLLGWNPKRDLKNVCHRIAVKVI
jgi:hypothetical protein